MKSSSAYPGGWQASPTCGWTSRAYNPGGKPSSYLTLRRKWSRDSIRLELPKTLTACPLPGSDDLVAFMDGPVVLAGLTDEQRTLVGDAARPETILHRTRNASGATGPATIAHGQGRNFAFTPIHEVIDEKYTMYFPVTSMPKPRR